MSDYAEENVHKIHKANYTLDKNQKKPAHHLRCQPAAITLAPAHIENRSIQNQELYKNIPLQRMPAWEKDIRNYALNHVHNGQPYNLILPVPLVQLLKQLINDTTSRGMFSKPSLEKLDPILQKLVDKRTQLDNDENFGDYLNNVSLAELMSDGQELDFSPLHQRNPDGQIIPWQTGADYAFTWGGIETSLNDSQRRIFYAQIQILKEYCTDADIHSVVEGAAINVKKPNTLFHFHGEVADAEQRALALFIKRLQLMTDYVRGVGELPHGGGKIKDTYQIKSTGSDPHLNGRHALYLKDRLQPNQMILYKPHSLTFENALLGNLGLIHQINIMAPQTPMAVMGFQPAAHTEDFITRTGDYANPLANAVAVQEQYRKLGMLEALMRMAGVTDLHGENIIFTAAGPIPVDAECGGSYGSTGITGGSSPGNISERNEFINPSALYKAAVLPPGPGPAPAHPPNPQQELARNYLANFNAGRAHMEQKLFHNKTAVLLDLRQGLAAVDSYRSLPIDTSELAADLQAYIMGTAAETLAQGRCEEVRNHFQHPNRAYYQEGVRADIYQSTFVKYYAQAIKAGTLPAFSVQLTSGRARAGSILLDDQVIGKITVGDRHTQITEAAMIHNYANRAAEVIDAPFLAALKTVIIAAIPLSEEQGLMAAKDTYGRVNGPCTQQSLRDALVQYLTSTHSDLTPEQRTDRAAFIAADDRLAPYY